MTIFHRRQRKHGIMGETAVTDDRCLRCDSACCRGFFSVEVTGDEYRVLRQLGALRLEFTLTGKFFLIIENGCEFLNGNSCGIYDHRPDICRRFSCIDDPH